MNSIALNQSCSACDKREHSKCTGSFTVIDQDGHSRYTCLCMCRWWVAQCPECPEWTSGSRRQHHEVVAAFEDHIRDKHRIKPILSQPNRGKDPVRVG